MKGLKAEELRAWSEAELRARITELEEERFRLQFRSATATLEEPLRLRTIRKDVARLQTVLTEKRKGGAGTKAKGEGKKGNSRNSKAVTR
jgi:large subunit ribosomal protein L29